MATMASNDGAQNTNGLSTTKSNPQFGMLIILGMIGASAGFTMYAKRSGQMLKQFEHYANQQQKRAPKRQIGPMTRQDWDMKRPRLEKDDFF